MARAILLCGIPASGKSTYAGTLQGFYVHSRDEARVRLRKTRASISEDEIWKKLLEEAARDIRLNRSIVLDSTLASPTRRDEAIALFSQLGAEVELHHVATPLHLCLRRNAQRPIASRVPPADLRQLHVRIEAGFRTHPLACPLVRIEV